MNKFLIVGFAVVCAIGGAGQAQASPAATEEWQIEFTGAEGSKVRGSIVWTDAQNINKPNYMETVESVSQASKRLTLPAGAIVSASGYSDAIKPVSVKIYRNRTECDDTPNPEKTLSSSKTCKP